ncbi:hypothetical protein Syun_017187 [Stephania yunnanensis]|uniref:Uncharacterized protein n=1 Tax=Stephania yunnanensis TaxID=152371 RepID=A0AAP0J7E2_9MAGN
MTTNKEYCLYVGRTHSHAHCHEKKTCFQCDKELVLKHVPKDSSNKSQLFYHCSSSYCPIFL